MTFAESLGLPPGVGVLGAFNPMRWVTAGSGGASSLINWKLVVIGGVGLIVGGVVLVKVVGALVSAASPVAAQAFRVSTPLALVGGG